MTNSGKSKFEYPASEMGPLLRLEVESQLLKDLNFYGLKTEGFSFDWSDVVQEGHCTNYLDGMLEAMSGVRVVDSQKQLVAEGWFDFIHGGDGNPLFVFWIFLKVKEENQWKKFGNGHIPQHVWDILPETSKELCMQKEGYDAAWANDPLVIKGIKK